MKRYIHASEELELNDYTGKPFEFQHGRKRFMARVTADNNLIRKAQITLIHPYDDAEYSWAKVEGPQATFIRDGKVLDRMTIWEYDEDDYENGFDEYVGEVLDTIATTLIDFDRDIEPIMVHN